MKKLIALFAVSTMASTAAVAGVALSGAASVSYDDNGTKASATTYDADLSFVGTTGTTTVTIGMDVDSATANITGVDMATKIGPISIAADMFNVDESNTDSGTGNIQAASEGDDRSVTVSLDVPVGDATIGLDNAGDGIISGTFSGVTISHTATGGSDKTTGSASIAGMDVSITRDGTTTTWSIATTVSGVDLTLTDAQKISAAFGIAGNTMTVTRNPERKVKAETQTKHNITLKKSWSTVAISRDLTSGATLSATYSTNDDSLTLKAAVAF